MRRLKNALFLCLLLCLLSFNLFSAPQSNFLNVDQNKTVPQTETDSISISNSTFGWHGPLSLNAQYSKNYGFIFQGQFTTLLNPFNGISIGLEGGKEQKRINATWAHALTKHQRFKLTAENLSQKMEFDFDSGNTKQWVYQNAFGLTYEYLFSHRWLNDINLNTAYSQAIGKTLSPREYIPITNQI